MDASAYETARARVEEDPEGYWRDVAARLDWIKPFTVVKDVSFDREDFRIRWYADGVLNASANCLDRHLATRGDQPAIVFEGDEPGTGETITYRGLHERVCRMA